MSKDKNKQTRLSLSSELVWKDKTTFEITVTIPKEGINREYQSVLKSLALSVEISGFRKGKAPLSATEDKLGKEHIFGEVIKRIMPRLYQKMLGKHKLAPIVEPKIVLESAKENQDWIIKIISCIAPEVNLGRYKEEIKKIKTTSQIWTPEKGVKQPTKEEQGVEEAKKVQEILQKLISFVKVKIPSLVVETEVQKRLVALIDQLQKTGLTIDQYLNTKGQTIEQLKKELSDQVSSEWKLELILAQIAEEEKIVVEKKDLDLFLKSKDKQGLIFDKNKQAPNPYLLARLLRRRKTLDYLLSL